MERIRPRKSHKPFRYVNGRYRPVSRRRLVRALASEYEFGNSLSKLYVALLTQALIDQDPTLTRKPDDQRLYKTDIVSNLERCGVRVMMHDKREEKSKETQNGH